MYSRNTRGREYSVPPGYDGSRFRRRRRDNGSRGADDEIIFVPDSGFAPVEESPSDESNRELSVSGIPTRHGAREQRRNYAIAEERAEQSQYDRITDDEEASSEATGTDSEKCAHAPKEKLTGILEKLGFTGGMSSDELLICAVIFLIASDVSDDGRSIGDVLLILALLLGIR